MVRGGGGGVGGLGGWVVGGLEVGELGEKGLGGLGIPGGWGGPWMLNMPGHFESPPILRHACWVTWVYPWSVDQPDCSTCMVRTVRT